ncbi:MAG: aminoacetone oxidase family FAD-binding enzyme [Lachnospiraceae bacterium]|nr:aminoacetone oxidase family FAD-binding enzyme [Lachnospiraceae bacterium]
MTSGEKIAIIGAGASGMTAAVSSARRGYKVTVYEHKQEVGLKIRITGHGKCNLTNTYMNVSCFNSDNSERIKTYLNEFGTDAAVGFFKSIGIETYEKNGYVYPVSNNAVEVADSLKKEAEMLGVEFILNCGELDINGLRDNYDRIILACGSNACKKTGSNGSGYKYLEKLGVKYSRILPALCPIYVEDNSFCDVNDGKRIIASVSAYSEGNLLASDTGEVQIKKNALSGVPVFQISRWISSALDNNQSCSIVLNLAPEMNDVPLFLRNRYTSPINEKLLFNVSRMSRFDHAQVCMGGVSLDDLTFDFELKAVPGVYVIGELCDVDGICGGYNLHWAWLSGNLCCK